MRNVLLWACMGFFIGCGNQSLSAVGSSVLSATGYVSEDQAKGIFSAGDKFVKSQEDLTPEQEYYLGRAVAAQVLESFPPQLSPNVTRYINQIGQVIVAVSDVPETFGGYHFAIMTSDQINAVSAPGGFIFVSNALLKQVSDEDELAAVLAHEVAHVVKRDGVKAVSNAKFLSALTDFSRQTASITASQISSPVDLGPITGVFTESVSGVTEKLLHKGFDRRQEYAADLYAAELLQRAGYDPQALIRVLKTIEGSSGIQAGGWFATHPAPADRIEELEDDFEFSPSQNAAPSREKRFKKILG